jgi:signal peptidase I
MGRHKELTCPQCNFVYTVNASEEVESRSGRVDSSLCGNCRFLATNLHGTPSFKGDRILVMMFPYDLPFLPGASPPVRWDVVVFRYPEEPEVSYIKRLVGLPGETVRIKHGDIYIKEPGSDLFRLQRKPLRHQSAMQMNVYDDRYRPKALVDRPEWRRWQSVTPAAWQARDPKLSHYQAEAKDSGEWVELRYQNLVPDPQQWDAILDDRPYSRPPRPTLITDFYPYNTNLTSEGAKQAKQIGEFRNETETALLQPHWVGDLTLSANLDVMSAKGELRFELIKGGVPYRCDIDWESGQARFLRGDEMLIEQDSPIKGPGRYQVEFANVDDRMTLLVNGRSIHESGVEYDRGDEVPIPTAADLSPAAVAVRRGSAAVSDLVLKRDIYYTQYPGRNDYGPVWADRYPHTAGPRTVGELFDFLSDPAQFADLGRVGSHDYELGEDRFLMLGDNSPRSKDSRGWDSSDLAWDTSNRQSWEVPRNLLTGKAFYVYWPHGVPFWPNTEVTPDFRIPFRPYFERMRWIR